MKTQWICRFAFCFLLFVFFLFVNFFSRLLVYFLVWSDNAILFLIMYILHSLNLRSLRRRGVAIYGCCPGLAEDSSSINKCVSPNKMYWIIAWLSSHTCYLYPSVDILWTIIFLFVVFPFVILLSVLRLKELSITTLVSC